jgi:hypothetical protein
VYTELLGIPADQLDGDYHQGFPAPCCGKPGAFKAFRSDAGDMPTVCNGCGGPKGTGGILFERDLAAKVLKVSRFEAQRRIDEFLGFPQVVGRLTPELLAGLQQVDSDWRLIPCDGRKRPIDPATGELMQAWALHTYDADGISELAESPHVRAVGLVLGETSGVIALDFDGDGSTAMFQEVYGVEWNRLPPTVAWTSGRPNRRQMAFRVPSDMWPYLRGRRFFNTADGRTVLELRGAGHQSIIAGEHPDTLGYEWIPGRSPADLQVADAPEWLLAPLMKSKAEPTAAEHQPSSAADRPRALDLLAHIPARDADNYDTWLNVGMALHSVDPGLLHEWKEWSKSSPKFDDEVCLSKWISFKGSGVSIGTLHFLAERAGYRYRRPQEERQQPGKATGAAADAGSADGPDELPRDEQIQLLLDQLLDLHLDPADPWAKQQATRAELWNLGVRGDAIDDRLLYALADRWDLPLKAGHAGARRGRTITDPLDSPAEDLLPGFLLWRRDHLLFGAGGSGKTLAAAAMGVAIIKGTAFLDQEIASERTGRVLWIGSDGGEGARAMVAEYLEDLGVADDPDVINGFTIWTAEGSDKLPAWSCSPSGLLELKEELEVGGYALVVIDSLKAVLELAGINFGIGPVGTLMRFMQALVGRHCSLLWLHHPAGGKAAGKGLQAAAGSQNINQIPSAVHQLTRVVSERGPVNEWSVHKLRGSQSREFSYRLSEDGFEVTKGEITGNARSAILDCIELRTEAGVPTQTHLIVTELFGTSESTIRNNLTWLRKRGLVSKAGTAWRLTDKGRKALALIKQGVARPWV